MFDHNKEAFIVHIATIILKITIYLDRKAQITLLKAEKAPIFVPTKYLDFTDIFFEKLAAILPEHIKINIYTIDLEEGKQPPHEPIYSLGPVELETLKTYIKTNLKTGFI